MREIEVKARLTDVGTFLAKAAEAGIVFGEPFTQADTTFLDGTPEGTPTWNIFRLREQQGTVLLTLKYRASKRHRDNHEFETIVGDATQTQRMLERLGYTTDVQINKTRRTAHYRGLELCVDEVERLGAFVEVEKLTDDNADPDKVQQELWELLRSLGVTPDSRVYHGYDTLIRELAMQPKRRKSNE